MSAGHVRKRLLDIGRDAATVNAPAIVGILLAAGSGSRFGGDKLLARLTSGEFAGEAMGAASFRQLREAVPNVIVVVRPGDPALAAMFGAAGARIVRCPLAAEGMGASLACGVRAAGEARWRPRSRGPPHAPAIWSSHIRG